MKVKVMAYVVRQAAGSGQLLVFEQSQHPEAGVQVPAGTVEAGEAPDAALWRELLEEAGLGQADVALVGKLAEASEPEWDQMRHVYLLKAVAKVPHKWTIIVGGDGEDRGMLFQYRWVNLEPGLLLAGGQDRWLALINEPRVQDQARS